MKRPSWRTFLAPGRHLFELGVATLVVAIALPEPAEPWALGTGGALAAVALAVHATGRGRWFARRPLRWLDLVLCNLCLLAVGLEVGIAAVAQVSDSPLLVQVSRFRQDTIARYRGQPGALHHGHPFNSRGFYDTEWDQARDPERFRIVALGDSFAVGIVPYRMNFLTLLDEALPGAEVLNLGIPATEPQEYRFLYTLEGAALDPDLVLVCVFVGNDITTYRTPPFLDPEGWYLFTVPARLAALVAEARRRGVELDQVATAGGDETDGGPSYHDDPDLEKPSLSREKYLDVELRRLANCHVKRRQEFEDTFEILAALDAQTGHRMVIALIPDELQVDDDLYEEIFAANPAIERRKFDRDRPQRLFADFCADRDIPLVDLLPALRRATEEGRCYHRNDSHWNARGNRVAAEVLAGALAERVP